MKKMIGFGAVALCAAVACADVTSANIVGYSNIKLVDGSKLGGAIFKGITTEGMKLTQLTPGGYLENPAWATPFVGWGCQGFIIIELLSTSGSIDSDKDGPLQFRWFHDFDFFGATGWAEKGCWKRSIGGDLVEITDSNDYEIKASDGLWVTVSQDWCAGMALGTPGLNLK